MRIAKLFLSIALTLALAGCATRRNPAPATQTPEMEMQENEEMMMKAAPAGVSNLADLVFAGSTRKDAKLTMVTSSTITYSSIADVTSLPQPAVNGSSSRTGVEKKLAQFSAWVYAYNLPDDNDLHVIIGDTSTFHPGATHLINVEVAGRPDTSDTAFKAVRTSFLALIGNPATMTHNTYTCVSTPIAISVSGGPFWDTSHPSGGSGTSTCPVGTMKTSNGWELHPVTSIK